MAVTVRVRATSGAEHVLTLADPVVVPAQTGLTPAGATCNGGQMITGQAVYAPGTNMVVRNGFSGTVLNANRIVISGSGSLTVTGRVQFAGATSGTRGFRIVRNGTVVYTRESSFAAAQDFIDGTSPSITVANGDLLGIEFMHHSANVSTRTIVGGEAATFFYTTVAGPVSAPSQVSGLTATPGASSIGLNWTAPANGGSPITDYVVQYKRSVDSNYLTFAEGVSATPSANVTALVAATSYDFRVAAVNSAGQGPFSITATATTQAGGTGTVIWQDKFDTAANGQLIKSTGDALFGPLLADATGYSRVSIVDDAPNGKFLRNNIPANDLGSFILVPKLIRPTDWATLEYNVRFDPNFDWQYGGKLGPGLHGVAPGRDAFEPSSCQARTGASFSTRLMWHGNNTNGTGSGRPFGSKLPPIPAGSNDIVTYAYVWMPVGNFNNCGNQISLGAMSKGVWHTIKQELKLNTVGQSNGIFRVWIDGVLKFQATDWQIRNSSVRIENILWDMHRGGGLPEWASPQNCHIDFRNVVVTDLLGG